MLHFLYAGYRIVNLRILRCDMNTAEDVQKLYVIFFTKLSFCNKTKEGAIFAYQLGHKICGQGVSIFFKGRLLTPQVLRSTFKNVLFFLVERFV